MAGDRKNAGLGNPDGLAARYPQQSQKDFLDDVLVDLNTTVEHAGRFYLEPDNVMQQPAYTRLNSSIAWHPADHRNGVTLWGRNLTNEAVISYGGTLVSGLRTVGYEATRTYGVTFDYHYQ
jgi:hypothetical protein